MTDNTIKLQAFLSRVGIASRRASEKLIEDKQVIVNGEIAHIGQRIDPDKDQVSYNGKKLKGNIKGLWKRKWAASGCLSVKKVHLPQQKCMAARDKKI